jgi:hypothetical protein
VAPEKALVVGDVVGKRRARLADCHEHDPHGCDTRA